MVQGALSPRRKRFRRWLLTALVVFVVGIVLWTWFALSWSYSSGDRAGVLLKFSRKGWICKTYEGQLAQYVVGGVAPQLWDFSTRDSELAARLATLVGQDIQVTYNEHRGVPTNCFAETPFFATQVTVLDRPSEPRLH